MKSMWTICFSLLLGVAQPVMADSAIVERFDQSTWRVLTTKVKQPTLVVFTSVTCAHCPGAIQRLASKRNTLGTQVLLYVVSIDADNATVLQSDPHYASADRLFLFQGSSQNLQFSVNPTWRGMTPYVSFIDQRGVVRFSLGEPKDRLLAEWLSQP